MPDNDSALEALNAKLDRLEFEFKERLDRLRYDLEGLRLGHQTTGLEAEATQSPPIVDDLVVSETSPSPSPDALVFVAEDLPPPATRRPNRHMAQLTKLLVIVLGPLGKITEQGLSAYRHYRDQGKAPAFLLTVAGLVAFTAGVGYLLQYSFNNLLGTNSKLSLGAAIGVAIVAFGAWLHGAKVNMRDYASSIIGLGVIVVYLCVYFAGPYYSAVSEPVAFGLFAATVVAGYVLALTFETRIVAVVTLAGGVIAPWLVTEPRNIGDAYALFLILLTAASLHLARRLDWRPLTQLTFASTLPVIELMALDQLASRTVLVGAVSAHFYLIFYFLLFDGRSLARDVSRQTLVLLTAEVAFFVLVAVQTVQDPALLSGLLIVNALVVGAPFFMGFAAERDSRPVFLLAAGALLGCGLLALAGVDYVGILWGLEAVALIHVGCRFRSVSVRYEGLLVLALALGGSLWAFGEWLLDGTWGVSAAWAALLAAAIYLELGAKLLSRVTAGAHAGLRVTPWLYELESVFIALTWVGLICIVDIDLIAVLAPIPLFGLLYFAARRRLFATQALALLHVCFLVYAVFMSALEVGNFHFSEQPLLAQIARIEAFALLWLLQAFYERLYPDSVFARLSRPLRQLFYLAVPVFFLPKVARDFTAFMPIALWASVAVSWILYRIVGSLPLRLELLALVLLASVFTLLGCAADYLGFSAMHSYWALGLGLVVYAALLVVEGAFYDIGAHPLRLAFLASGFYVAAALFAVSFALSGSLTLANALTAVYFASVVSLLAWLPFVRPILKSAYRLVVVFTAGTVIVSSAFASTFVAVVFFDLLALGAWGFLLHSTRSSARLSRRLCCGPIFQQWIWHGLLLLTYGIANDRLAGDVFGPGTSVCLVLHATLVLFVTLRPRWGRLIRLAIALFSIAGLKIIFYDMADFSIVEKIIALMIIGVVLLGAAYGYQQLGDREASPTPGEAT